METAAVFWEQLIEDLRVAALFAAGLGQYEVTPHL
jgi:hypothetical protein